MQAWTGLRRGDALLLVVPRLLRYFFGRGGRGVGRVLSERKRITIYPYETRALSEDVRNLEL